MGKPPLTAVALICSLIANAFLAGYILSAHVRLMPPPMPFERMEKALTHVSPQYRDDVQEQINEHRKILDQRMQGMRGEFDKIQSILTAPTFDAEALRAIQKDMANSEGARGDMLSLLIDIAQALPDEERVKFFKEAAPERPPFGGPRPPFSR